MKAEHRKELQTNTLADFLGRLLRGTRGGLSFSWFWVIVVLIVIFAVVVTIVIWKNRARTAAEAWQSLQFNDEKSLDDLAGHMATTNAGQAARVTIGFHYLWDNMRRISDSKPERLEPAFQGLRRYFDQLAEEFKDDPIRVSEAKYHAAVATEVLAVVDIKYLQEAKKAFEALTTEELAATPFGVLAKKRLEQYNNRAEYEAIERFYREFRARSKF